MVGTERWIFSGWGVELGEEYSQANKGVNGGGGPGGVDKGVFISWLPSSILPTPVLLAPGSLFF